MQMLSLDPEGEFSIAADEIKIRKALPVQVQERGIRRHRRRYIAPAVRMNPDLHILLRTALIQPLALIRRQRYRLFQIQCCQELLHGLASSTPTSKPVVQGAHRKLLHKREIPEPW